MHGGISPSLDSLDNIRQLDRIQEAILVPQTLNPEIQKKHDDGWKIHHEDVFPIEDRDFPMSC